MAGITVLISDKINFESKLIRRHWEEHSKLSKGTIHQEGIAIFNIYSMRTRTSKFVKEAFEQHKSHSEPPTLIAEAFDDPLSLLDRVSRQKLNRDMLKVIDEIIVSINRRDLPRNLQNLSPKHGRICLLLTIS